MPAINGLLPIASSQAVKKQGAHSGSNEPKLAPVKETAKPENKGAESDKQDLKISEKKRFDETLEEKKKDRELAFEQEAGSPSESVIQVKEPLNELAASGNALPLTGETLPTMASEKAANHAAFDSAEPVLAVVSSETASPTPAESLATEQGGTLVVDQGTNLTAEQAVPSIVTQESSVQEQLLEQTPETEQSVEASDSLLFADEDAQLAASVQTSDTQSQGDAPNTIPKSDLDGALAEQTQRNLSNNNAATNDTRAVADQAERVRAWRGLNAQELQSTATQTPRQETAVNANTADQSGQFQQFAQSLRLAVKQGESSAGSIGSERSVTSTSASSASTSAEALTSWRTETAQTQLLGANRQGSNASSFAQTMQASNFGQALGQKVGQNAWGESIAQRVTLMAGQKMSSAQIQLDPPELGAMTVKVTVNGDQASVSFHSAHAVVRDALEASFPRLQEMLGQQGIELADAQVSDQSSAQQDSRGSANSVAHGDVLGSEEEGVVLSSQTVHSATGLIDYYA